MSTTHFNAVLTAPLFVILCLVGCQPRSASGPVEKDIHPATMPTLRPGEAVATFAGGCFWATAEEFTSLKGVHTVVSGYAGGDLSYPTYEQVGTGQTGHAEAVQVYYDPTIISFDTLLIAFFVGHDASSRNRQGPDVGTHYRSAAFYRTSDEKARIDAAIRRENASGRYSRPIVTEVTPFTAFYPAEVYHQDYYRQHPDELYIRTVSQPKVERFRERMADWQKDSER